jgi:hypothetical protein
MSWVMVTVMVMREAMREGLGLIRGLTPIRTRMWTRARERMRMRTMIVLMSCGLGLDRSTRIE